MKRASVWPPTGGLRAVGELVNDALSSSFTGSRADLERTTVTQVDSVLMLLVLLARAAHLLQALVDVTLGYRAYSHPWAAVVAAAACAIESLLLAVALARRRRLTCPLLAADACFGLVCLGLLSVATTHTVGRSGTIDWMLPYTVTTAAGLGLLVAPRQIGPGEQAERRYDWQGALVVVVLAAGYAASVSLPSLVRGETPVQVLTNVCNYPVFYLVAAGVSVGLRRRLDVIAQRNEDAKQQAAERAEQATWRTAAVDVFGPVLTLLDRAAAMGDAVPPQLRSEAARLSDLIDATDRAGELGVLE